MKIDVVVGNPPYNNDLYLDFVTKAHNWADKVTCMITPAKWQGYGGGNSKTKEKNIAFCDNIVPHMKNLIYYPNAKEIFNIALSGGVNIFDVFKIDTYDEKIITIIENGKKVEDKVKRTLNYCYIGINDKIASIINKVSSGDLLKDSKTVMQPERGYFLFRGNIPFDDVIDKYGDDTSDIYIATHKGDSIRKAYIKRDAIKHLDQVDMYKLDISQRTFENGAYTSILRQPKEIGHNGNSCTVCIGTLEECKSADSFYGSKLMFFICKTLYGQQTLTEESFSYLPDPGAFDHIFTDEELYQKYNLTEEEINIIESVIKERK